MEKSKPLRLRGLKSCRRRWLCGRRGSKPLRLRGLKSLSSLNITEFILVEALAASWIEIFLVIETPYHMFVEALAASWIEIGNGIYDWIPYRSKPLRLRGLKYVRPLKSLFQQCRSPCGFVDWNKFAPGEIQGFFCISPAVLWVENKIQNIVKKSLFCGRMIIKG